MQRSTQRLPRPETSTVLATVAGRPHRRHGCRAMRRSMSALPHGVQGGAGSSSDELTARDRNRSASGTRLLPLALENYAIHRHSRAEPKIERMHDRDQARALLSDGIRACTHCRPDTDLGVLG